MTIDIKAIMTAFLLGISAVVVQPTPLAQSQPAPVAELVAHDNVTIEASVQGSGPPIVILPSLGRSDYGDYDEVGQIAAQSSA